MSLPLLRNDNYEPESYHPPAIVRSVGSALSSSLGDNDAVDLVSGERDKQEEYITRLVGLMSIFLAIMIVWFVVIIVLKCCGSLVGCASGRAFDARDTAGGGRQKTTPSLPVQENGIVQTPSSEDEEFEENNHVLSPIREVEYESGESSSLSIKTSRKVRSIRRRAALTRGFFVFFAILVLACGVALSMVSYRRFKDATATSEDVTTELFSVTDHVVDVTTSVEIFSIGASNAIRALPTESNGGSSSLCPNLTDEELEDQLGIDLDLIVADATREFDRLKAMVDDVIVGVRDVVREIDSYVENVDNVTDNIDSRLWILLLFIVIIMVLTTILLIGTVLAWLGLPRNSSCLECSLSWGVLPLLILATVLSWIFVLVFYIGAVGTSNVCLAGPSPGSPDVTVRGFIDQSDIGDDPLLYRYVVQYTIEACRGSDPTQELVDINNLIRDVIDAIDGLIESIYDVGIDILRAQCGGTGIDDLLDFLVSRAAGLRNIVDSINEARDALMCPSINPLYQKTLYEGFCTEVAHGTAAGFVLFLLMSVGLMVLISLRASWKKTVFE